MTPPDLKKGAVPLDAAANEAASRNADVSPPSERDAAQEQAHSDGFTGPVMQTLSWLYNETKAGRVNAISIVFVDDSHVPQHAFFAGAGMAVPLLAGMMCGTDAIKSGALQTMTNYRAFRQEKAKHDASQSSGAQPGEGGATKPN